MLSTMKLSLIDKHDTGTRLINMSITV